MTKKNIYSKQKLLLYFDENFPLGTVNYFKKNKNLKVKCKVFSVFDFNTDKRNDKFHFNFCKRNGFILVTLDKDFMDDRLFPFGRLPGIIRIVASKKDKDKIILLSINIIEFLSHFPLAKFFVGDAKFQVNSNYCLMRGRDFLTRKVKTLKIFPGDDIIKVASKFNYPTGFKYVGRKK